MKVYVLEAYDLDQSYIVSIWREHWKAIDELKRLVRTADTDIDYDIEEYEIQE